jgi:hypothetical protein
VGPEHQVAADCRRQHTDQHGRDTDDDKGEDDVGAIKLYSLSKIVEAQLPVPLSERRHQRQTERIDEKRQHHRQ